MIYQLSRKIELSANWVFATGNVLTLPKSVYPSLLYPPELNHFTNVGSTQGDAINISLPWTNTSFSSRQPTEIFEYGGKNNTRLPAYHRFDIGVNFRKQKKRGIRTWNFSIYNLYARRNPYYVIYVFQGGSIKDPFKAKGEFRAVSLFQIVPSFAYNFKF